MKPDSTTQALIRTLEDQRYQAILDGDFDAFARLVAPDLIYTHSSGVIDTLDSYLDKCRQGYYVYHLIDHPITDIRIVGDVALVVGEMNATITSGGILKTLQNRCLAVWECREGQWKLVAYQPTPFKQPQG